MPVIVGGSGGAGGDYTVSAIAVMLDGEYPGHGYGASYTAYADAHPADSPEQAYLAFALTAAGTALPRTLAAVVADEGKIAKQVATFPNLNPLTGLSAIGDFFQRLTQANTWIRVGQVALGLVLLAVGVARITHAVPIATKVAKTAGAVALA